MLYLYSLTRTSTIYKRIYKNVQRKQGTKFPKD
jgi:hypothetical protein